MAVAAQSHNDTAFVEPVAPGAQAPVPIQNEPRHHLKFGNQYVRIFDVLILPGDTTLFHTHVHDGIGIKLTDARIVEQAYHGKSQQSTVKRGEVGFSHYPNPLIHRVSNVGSAPFRNIFVEVLPSAASTTKMTPTSKAAGRTLLLENERVRIFRLVLAPGKSIEAAKLAPRGVRVAISNGRVVIEAQGKKFKTENLKPGDFQWEDAHAKYSLRNAGSSSFEAVDIELK